jgi:rare lipoprotein A
MTPRTPPTALLRSLALLTLLVLVAGLGAACRTAGRGRPGDTQRGVASWYGPKFHGRATASGERYDMNGLTAAHRTLPFGTLLEVHNLTTGQRVRVRVNDRGPFAHGRIVDLSYAAARQIGLVGPGTARVEIRVLAPEVAPEDRLFAHVRFTVQVGAFRESGRAATLQRELAGLFPESIVRNDGGWYRVQVGSFDWRRKAEATRRELQRRGYPAQVVPLLPDTL